MNKVNNIVNVATEANRLLSNIPMLLLLIRDGIELNYSSWFEWQKVARSILIADFFDFYNEIDNQREVLKIALKQKVLPDELREAMKKEGGAK